MARELVLTKDVLASESSRGHGARHRWGRLGRTGHGDRGHGHKGPCHAHADRLAQVAPGTDVRVARVHGDDLFRGKMMAMGIVPGASLSVLQGGLGRPQLIALAGSRFVLDPRSSELVSVRVAGDKEGCAS